MLGIRGLDYSAGIIPGGTIRNAGYDFVIRYVDDPKVVHTRKHIAPAEYADLVKNGVDVWLVFEVGIDDMLKGYDAGVRNAKRARAGADWIGYPPGRIIFMACDMHVTAAQLKSALAYVDGAVSVLGNAATGVYGFVELTEACFASKRGAAYWQAGRAPLTGHIHVWQRNDGFKNVGGITCDINELYIEIPGEGSEGDDMFSDADRQMLQELHDRVARLETAWPGGVTDDKNSSYDLFQFTKRTNVEVRQMWLDVKAIMKKLGATR